MLRLPYMCCRIERCVSTDLHAQVRRTQALTVLLALVRADPGATTLETLQTSGLLGSLLQDLTSNARADLLKVRAAAAVHASPVCSGDCPRLGMGLICSLALRPRQRGSRNLAASVGPHSQFQAHLHTAYSPLFSIQG